MKHKQFLFLFFLFILAEMLTLVWFSNDNSNVLQDSVTVNEAVQSVEADWHRIDTHRNITNLDYTVLDNEGTVRFRTKPGLSESIHDAVIHRDTILDIEADGAVAGKIILYNNNPEIFGNNKNKLVTAIALAGFVQCVFFVVYWLSLNRRIVKPFHKLKKFAESVAGGNLDIPLEMDRHNIFGAFTESFDIMRSELKKARIAEAKANASKKELVAKLSHDIRTPVASIKAVSEVGAALAEDEKNRQNYAHIIHKSDQINTLVTNLFSATLEELQQLTTTPADMNSGEVFEMLERADYFHFAQIPEVPECLVIADKLRLQQVFDNLFANSYKYANTKIDVAVSLADDRLAIIIEDYGGGVTDNELPLLKEKFKRGKGSETVDGAGLGLYISDYLMKEMQGELVLENSSHGLRTTVFLSLA